MNQSSDHHLQSSNHLSHTQGGPAIPLQALNTTSHLPESSGRYSLESRDGDDFVDAIETIYSERETLPQPSLARIGKRKQEDLYCPSFLALANYLLQSRSCRTPQNIMALQQLDLPLSRPEIQRRSYSIRSSLRRNADGIAGGTDGVPDQPI